MAEEKKQGKSKKFKTEREEELYVAPEDRWMIWPKPPTLFEQYKGLTREHVKQVVDKQYMCPKCKAMRNVLYSHLEFNKKVKTDQGDKIIHSKHLAAFCRICNTNIRWVKDTPARWQAMRERDNHTEARETRRRNRARAA